MPALGSTAARWRADRLPALRHAAPALLAYATVRLLGVVVLASWAWATGDSATRLLSRRWDSTWYTGIAENGYGFTRYLDEGRTLSDLAFFPLFPGLERLVAEVSPLRASDAGLVISAVASLVAAWGVFAVGDLLYGRRVGVVLAVLWGVLPTAIVQSMAYAESLFTALAAWAVHAVLSGRWVLAGVLSSLAGLTRPLGLAVAAAVVVAAVLTLTADRKPGEDSPARRRIVVGMLVAPVGWLAYVAWVGARRDDPLGYLEIQEQWGNGFDGGRAFAAFVWNRLTGPGLVGGLGMCAAVALVAWLYVLCIRQRQPVALLVFTGVVLALALGGSDYFGSKPRLLMPAFALLLPVALAIAKARPARAALALGAVAVASAVYGAFWLHGDGPP